MSSAPVPMWNPAFNRSFVVFGLPWIRRDGCLWADGFQTLLPEQKHKLKDSSGFQAGVKHEQISVNLHKIIQRMQLLITFQVNENIYLFIYFCYHSIACLEGAVGNLGLLFILESPVDGSVSLISFLIPSCTFFAIFLKKNLTRCLPHLN